MFARSFLTSVKVASILDPAVNREHEEFESLWQEYRKGNDLTKIPVKEGAKLALFELAPLSRKQLLKVMSMSIPLEQCTEAVAFSLRSVSGFEVNGEPLEISHSNVDGEKRVKPDCLDKLFDPLLFGELGARVLELNRLDPTKG